VTSHAFAGTVALAGSGGSPEDDDAMGRLAGSAKDHTEHRLVVEEIAAALRPRTVELEVPVEPSVVRLRSDARLGTLIRGRLRPGPDGGCDPDDSALGLLAAIHPTPAVGGVPRAAALERIAALEPLPRGYWAGAVGWVDGTGDGEWTLAIRSALLGDGSARLHAGAGVVDGSEPDRECSETGVKLVPVLEALEPGLSRHV
jgi:isochorismate synthase EntC